MLRVTGFFCNPPKNLLLEWERAIQIALLGVTLLHGVDAVTAWIRTVTSKTNDIDHLTVKPCRVSAICYGDVIIFDYGVDLFDTTFSTWMYCTDQELMTYDIARYAIL